MTLVANLLRKVPSAKFICCCWRNPRCDCHITRTPECNDPPKIWANYLKNTLTGKLLKEYSVFPVPLKNYDELISGTVDKMAYFYKTHLATLSHNRIMLNIDSSSTSFQVFRNTAAQQMRTFMMCW